MSPGSVGGLTKREAYEVLLLAAARRQPVAAIYDGLPRLFCPHVLGRKSGRLHALCYQFEGSSHSGLVSAAGAVGWRCFAVDKLSEVGLRMGDWHTAPGIGTQTCVDEIDFDIDIDIDAQAEEMQPAEVPQ